MRQNKRRSSRSSVSAPSGAKRKPAGAARPAGRVAKKKTVSRRGRKMSTEAVGKRVSQGAERVVSSIRSAWGAQKRTKAA